MAVDVRKPGAAGTDTIEKGNAFIVREGHLAVLDRNSRDADTLAIYAPGAWASAEVVEEAR